MKNLPESYKNKFLDNKNILWKKIDNKWIGKRSVLTRDLKICWIEETEMNNIKYLWCGINANYLEIF